MTKERYNFTLDRTTKNRIVQLSKESIRLTGRHLSQSEIVEMAIYKMFVDKREQLEKHYNKLKLELESVEAELMAIKQREKRSQEIEW